MKKYLLFLMMAACAIINAQKPDYDLFTVNDLSNISKEKEELLKELIQNPGELDYFKHFYYSSLKAGKSRYSEAERHFSDFMAELKSEIQNIRKSNNTKVVKLVYDKVNSTYLRSMDIQAGFSDIFSNGAYNYRTAAAIYMLVLHGLEIPYTISEKYTHTEIVAFPESEEIRMIGPEIDQSGGIKFLDILTDFKNEYVKKLRDNKLVDEDETRNKTNVEIFNESFFYDKVRGPKEYIGILHFWNSMGTGVEDDLKNELNAAITGNLYCPGFRGNMLISSKLSLMLSKKSYETIDDLKNLEMVARIPYTVEEVQINNTYDYFTEKILFEKSNIRLFDTCSKYIIGTTVNKDFKKHVELIYNTEKGRFLLLQYNYGAAIPYLLKAHKSTPENIKLTNMAVEAIYENWKLKDDTSGIMGYTLNDTFLLHDSRYLQIFCFYLGERITNAYAKPDFKEGDQYLFWFEDLVRRDAKLMRSGDELNDVYLAPARYYRKMKNPVKAKEYLNRGLKLFPNDYDMQMMLSTLK